MKRAEIMLSMCDEIGIKGGITNQILDFVKDNETLSDKDFFNKIKTDLPFIQFGYDYKQLKNQNSIRFNLNLLKIVMIVSFSIAFIMVLSIIGA